MQKAQKNSFVSKHDGVESCNKKIWCYNKATVREASKYFSVSKSTVHTDVAYRLQKIDRELWLKVKEVLEENKQTRHIRGGMATRAKYKNSGT